MPLTLKNILSAIADSKQGFTFGQPKRVDDNALGIVLPILRKTAAHRNYTTFSEVEAEVFLTDTGMIDRVHAKNGTDQTVLIRSGMILKGKTQERVVVKSAVLAPGQEQDIEVRCVHASRPISKQADMKYGGYVPDNLTRTIITTAGSTDQGVIWNEVRGATACYFSIQGRGSSMGIPHQTYTAVDGDSIIAENAAAIVHGGEYVVPASDDLFGSISKFAAGMADKLGKITRLDNQAGMALLTENGCETLEAYDVPQSWEAMHEAAIARSGETLFRMDEDSAFEYKPERAVGQVQTVLRQEYDQRVLYEHRPSNGEAHVRIVSLTGPTHVGQAVEIDKRVAHLILVRKA